MRIIMYEFSDISIAFEHDNSKLNQNWRRRRFV